MSQLLRKEFRPIIFLLVGILLVALSFATWFYAVSPIAGLAVYSLDRPTTAPRIIGSAANLTEYFGHNEAFEPTPFNQSRPIDYLFNTTLNLNVTGGGPVEVIIYVGNQIAFDVTTNATMRAITCNTTRYDMYNSTNRPAGLFPNVVSNVQVSWLDAFTGGPSPYMIVKSLNPANITSVSYRFYYEGTLRSSSGITLFMFMIGIIIIIIEGVVLIRTLIRRVRER